MTFVACNCGHCTVCYLVAGIEEQNKEVAALCTRNEKLEKVREAAGVLLRTGVKWELEEALAECEEVGRG